VSIFHQEFRSLRELTERYIQGTVDYEPLPIGKPSTGDSLPALELERVANSEKLSLPLLAGINSTVIFFQANCTTCGVNNILAKLQQINSERRSLSDLRTYPVFSRSFDIKQLKAYGASLGENLLIATEFCPQWEDEYYVGPGSGKEPFVISIGRTGQIDKVEGFADWANRKMSNRSSDAQPVGRL
jgi:hypothetical protein